MNKKNDTFVREKLVISTVFHNAKKKKKSVVTDTALFVGGTVNKSD